MNMYALLENWDLAGIFTQEHQEPAAYGFAPTRADFSEADHDFLVQNGRPDLVAAETSEAALNAVDFL